MIAEKEVRNKLLSFLQKRLSLGDFEAWLVSESWNMHQDSTPAAQDLVSAIELLLAERSGHELNDFEFRKELSSLADNISSSVEVTPAGIAPLQNAPRLQPSSTGATTYQASVGSLVLLQV